MSDQESPTRILVERQTCGKSLGLAAVVTVAGTSALPAQSPLPSPRMVDVDGSPMRVWTAGFEQRKSGQPAVKARRGTTSRQVTEPPALESV